MVATTCLGFTHPMEVSTLLLPHPLARVSTAQPAACTLPRLDAPEDSKVSGDKEGKEGLQEERERVGERGKARLREV